MLKKSLITLAGGLLCLFAFTANAESTVNDLFNQPGDPTAGNPKGDVTIVEFFDYQCSHCVSMIPVISAIIKANPNVRVVFKDYPVRGPVSELAARAALAANKQGKYNQFSHALLVANDLTPDTIFEIAKSVGLNVPQLQKDIESKEVKNILRSTIALAEKLNVRGTPAFFIGKTNSQDTNNIAFVYGEMSQNELQAEISRQ